MSVGFENDFAVVDNGITVEIDNYRAPAIADNGMVGRAVWGAARGLGLMRLGIDPLGPADTVRGTPRAITIDNAR